MNDYRNYMDSVSVDMALHRKIMSRLTKRTLPVRRSIALSRYASAFACAALLLISIWAVPRLVPSNVAQPPVVQPNGTVPPVTTRPGTPGRQEYALLFNQVQGAHSQNKRHDPGYFTQELSREDIGALFGSAWESIAEGRTIEAHAGFSGEGVLDRVTATCEQADTGTTTTILVAKGPVWIDYIHEGEPEVSDVHGVSVIAGYWKSASAGGKMFYYANFELGQAGYYMEVSGDESAKEELTALVNLVVEGGAAADLDIVPEFIPEWRYDELSLAQAQADPDFGDYVPERVPTGFVFESSRRTMDQSSDKLSITYINGMKYVEVTAARLTEKNRARTADITKPETYDLSLYPIPRADSVPDQLREVVGNPIFKAEELTLETVQSRAYTVDDVGDEPGYRMRFSVLYGDVVVEVSAKGAQPEDIFSMLKEIKSGQ
jgi:hypothetical protein